MTKEHQYLKQKRYIVTYAFIVGVTILNVLINFENKLVVGNVKLSIFLYTLAMNTIDTYESFVGMVLISIVTVILIGLTLYLLSVMAKKLIILLEDEAMNTIDTIKVILLTFGMIELITIYSVMTYPIMENTIATHTVQILAVIMLLVSEIINLRKLIRNQMVEAEQPTQTN